MREPRNPFRLRRSESIDTETSFLTLFEPGILEIVPTHGLLGDGPYSPKCCRRGEDKPYSALYAQHLTHTLRTTHR